MPQTPKEKPEKTDAAENSNLSDDQRKRGYYYDDAHGYQEFDPDAAEDEEDKAED